MKILITTRADSRIKNITDITHPSIRRYADNVGADFRCLDGDINEISSRGRIHYRIMKLFYLLDSYDRILNLDSDILISLTCPNLFEIVPYHKIGVVLEDCGSRKENRRERIRLSQQKFGDIGWKDQYINTGVILVSRVHRDIFTKIDDQYYDDTGYDDVHLGYLIKKFGIVIQDIGFKWNHMTMFSEEWNGSPSRFDSHIIHYAGQGIFEQEMKNRLEQIKSDAQQNESSSFNYILR